MPSIKRWFPVSHDINRDPEVWALTRQCGDRSLRVWLEVLSIADRADGTLAGRSPELSETLASLCRTTKKSALEVLRFAQSRQWLSSEEPLRVLNYAKYHRSREQVSSDKKTNEFPYRKYDVASEPSEPSEPSLRPNLTPKKVLFSHTQNEEGTRIEDSNKETVGKGNGDDRFNPRVTQMLHELVQKLGAKKPGQSVAPDIMQSLRSSFAPPDPEARRQLLHEQAAALLAAEKLEKEKSDGSLD